MKVLAARSSDTDELLDLAVKRYRHIDRYELAAAHQNPEMFPQRQSFKAVADNGQVIGAGEWFRPVIFPTGRTAVRITVKQRFEGAGVGTALRNTLFETLPPDTSLISTLIPDNDQRSVDIVQHWGFTIESHPIRSELSLASVSAPKPVDGITIENRADLDFPDAAAVEEMLSASHTDPEAAVGIRVTLQDLVTAGNGNTHVAVLARLGDKPAGLTAGVIVDNSLYISYTGVHPQYRGRRLARIIKQSAHVQAAQHGAKRSITYNDERNTPIRRVNTALGYTIKFGSYRMTRPRPTIASG